MGFLAQRWARLQQVAERRLPALTRYKAAEALPIRLHSRRIYIIPSGFGVFAAAVLSVMLLGALNFNNNAAMLFTFLLAGVLLASMPSTVAELAGIELVAVGALPVHAGDPALLRFSWRTDTPAERERLQLSGADLTEVFALTGGSGDCHVQVPTTKRGWQAVGRWSLVSEQSFGLFHAWSVLNPDERILVYPKPEAGGPPAPHAGQKLAARHPAQSGDDWHALRDYRPGDPQRAVAWKVSARQDRLLVNEYATPSTSDLLLDWHALGLGDREARIARLTRWVREAEQVDARFELRLPDQHFGPDHGPAHAAACLRALALLP